MESLRCFASRRSAGKSITVAGKPIEIEETRKTIFKSLDLAFFATGAELAQQLAPEAIQRGCVVIDNSSAYRQHKQVPLVIPEINAGAGYKHRGLLANPNCSIAVSLMGLYPLHKAFGLKRVICSTYQAVSGAGAEGLTELQDQVHAWAEGREEAEPQVFPHHNIAFNLIPHVDRFGKDGYTGEETKMLKEGRKILELPELKLSATCVRVPVFRAHSIAMNAEFEKPVDLRLARQAIEIFEGAELCDEPESCVYPTPLQFSERVRCGVGRLRKDSVFDNGLALFVSGDQLWKGAALNAVQIAESLDMAGKLTMPSRPLFVAPAKKAAAKKKTTAKKKVLAGKKAAARKKK